MHLVRQVRVRLALVLPNLRHSAIPDHNQLVAVGANLLRRDLAVVTSPGSRNEGLENGQVDRIVVGSVLGTVGLVPRRILGFILRGVVASDILASLVSKGLVLCAILRRHRGVAGDIIGRLGVVLLLTAVATSVIGRNR